MFDKKTLQNPHDSFIFEIGCYHSHRNADHEIVDTSIDFINTLNSHMDAQLHALDDPGQHHYKTRRYMQYMSKAVFTAYLVLRTVRYCQKGPQPVRNIAKSEYLRFITTLERSLCAVNPENLTTESVRTLISELMNTREVMLFWLLPVTEVYAIIALVDHAEIREFLHARIKDGNIFGQSYGSALKSWLIRDLNWKAKFTDFMVVNSVSQKANEELVTGYTLDHYYNQHAKSFFDCTISNRAVVEAMAPHSFDDILTH